jgi:DNA-binding response OmpR family regulator
MENKPSILLVEDDPNFGMILKNYLELKKFKVTLATNGQEGLKMFKEQLHDLLILDVMMPVMDGFTLAKNIRKQNAEIPIIFLTAKSMEYDKLEGFQIGADDYMTKPFSMEELLMRVNAVMRRSGATKEKFEVQQFNIGKYTFDYQKQILAFDGQQQKLTSKESDLLKLLCIKINDVLERTYALKLIWGNDSYFNARSMDVYVTKLRKYLSRDPKIEIINVHGKGFKLLVANPS